MSSNYPDRIDTDIEIRTVRNNITEIGADVLNSIKSATIAIEKYVGTTTGSKFSLTYRLNKVIDNNGRLRQSAIERAGFLTGPITNSDVDPNAGIVESKLTLDYSTSDLQNQVNVLRSRTDLSVSQVLATATTVANHLNSSAVGAHLATNISYDPTTNTYYGTPSAAPFFDDDDDNVQLAINRLTSVLRMHKEAVVTSVTPFGEHYSSAIYFDNTDVDELTENEDVQGALVDAFNLYNTNMVVHRDEQHANGIVRNTNTIMGTSSGYEFASAVAVTWTAGSSIVTRAAGSFIVDGVSPGNTIVVTGAANSDDNGSYQVIEVTSSTTLNIVGTFEAASGAAAMAAMPLVNFSAAPSPVEASCNALNCTPHIWVGDTAATDVFVCQPGAAVVASDEIDLPALAQAMFVDADYIFDVIVNGSGGPATVNVDLTTGGFIDLASYATTLSTLTTRNIVRAINRVAVDEHRPFHAYEKDGNQIAIAHDGIRVNSANPYDTTDDQNDIIQLQDGTSGANDMAISLLGFSAAQLGVVIPAFPNFNNYYYVNGERRRIIRCLTQNGIYDYINVDVAGNTLTNFELVDGTASNPEDFELRSGDVVRFLSGTAALENRSFTIQIVNTGVNVVLRDVTGVTEPSIRMVVYRNVASAEYEATSTECELYRIGIDEYGDVFKQRRLSYGNSTKLIATALKVVNCSRTLPGSAVGVPYTLGVGQNVATTFGAGGIYDPEDYNSLYDVATAMTLFTLQFSDGTNPGEIVQMEDFNALGFNKSVQTYRLYLANHIDWIDVEVDYDLFSGLAIVGATTLTITAYIEMDEERNLMLSSSLYADSPYAPSYDLNSFVVTDERFFGNVGAQNIRSDFKDSIWEMHRGIGNYILNGMLLTQGAAQSLVCSGGTAFIGGHRVDFDAATITAAHTISSGYINDYLGVYAFEDGRVDVIPVVEGRPQEEHLILGVAYGGAGGIGSNIYNAPDYTNINEKILITVSQDPKQGMFTDIRSAVEYARYVLEIRNSFHDKLLSGDTDDPGAVIYIQEGNDYLIGLSITVPERISLIGSGRPRLIASGDVVPQTSMLKFEGENVIENIRFGHESTGTPNITQGLLWIAGDSVTIRDCDIIVNEADIVAAVFSDGANMVHIENNYFAGGIFAKDLIKLDTVEDNYITNNTITSGATADQMIEVTAAIRLKICGNTIRGTGSGVANIDISGISEHIIIDGNTMTAVTNYSVSIANADYVNITNNIIKTSYGIYYTNTASHENLAITNNIFESCVRNVYINVVGGAVSFTGLLVTDNIGDAIGAGNHNVYAYGTGNLINAKVNDNVFASGGGVNVYVAVAATIVDVDISHNSLTNTNNQFNIDLNTGGTISDATMLSNYCSTGTSANIGVLATGAINRVKVSDSSLTSTSYNVFVDGAAAINDLYIENNYMTSSTAFVQNIFVQNDGASSRYHIEGNTIVFSGASSVENIYLDVNSTLYYVYICNNMIWGTATANHNLKIDGTPQHLFIEFNYMINLGDVANSLGNIELSGVSIDGVSIVGNELVCFGDPADTTSSNIYVGTITNSIESIVIGNNIIDNSEYMGIVFNIGNETLNRATISGNIINSKDNNVFVAGATSIYNYLVIDSNVMTIAGSVVSENIKIDSSSATFIKICDNSLTSNNGAGSSVYLSDITHLIVSDNMFDGGGSSTDGIELVNSSMGAITGNIFSSDFSNYIMGTAITAAAANFWDNFHISDNFPDAADFTNRAATEAGTTGAGADIANHAWAPAGGGFVWADGNPNVGGWKLLDDSMDWRYRYIEFTCIGYDASGAGGTGIGGSYFGAAVTGPSATAQPAIKYSLNAYTNVSLGMFYSNDGVSVAGGVPVTESGVIHNDGGGNDAYLSVCNGTGGNAGDLYIYTEAGVTEFDDYAIKLHYSPKLTETI